MKKILSVCFALVMVLCFSTTALAAGGFVTSPSNNLAPEVIEPSDGSIVIHSYAERHELSEEQRNTFEEAYNTIKNNSDITSLNEKLGEAAKNKSIDSSKLSVSDFFNLKHRDNNASGSYSVTLKADTTNGFFALMSYVNGAWKLVEDAKIQNGNLVFTAENFGPYAIVVNTEGATSPQTGLTKTTESDNYVIILCGAIMLASACGAFVMWKKSKKYSA